MSKAPLAVAGLIGVPLYFAALMASSLGLDKPRYVGTHGMPGSAGTEAKIWLAALIAPGILVAVAVVAMVVARRFGVYLVSVAGIVCCLVLPGLSQGWIAGHTARFPLGVDFIKDSDPSNLSTKGEWEKAAQATVTSITHWTLGLAIGAIVVGLLVEWRRRSDRAALQITSTPAVVTGEAEASPVVEP
ncbi:MAG: hypothetical protein JOZ56_06770 [Actinobacteria bacterium]|nr:hypothetical protein [Actinomycetota bacterium]